MKNDKNAEYEKKEIDSGHPSVYDKKQ